MATKSYAINHTHGLTERHETWADAWAGLVAVYGAETYAVDAHGFQVDGDSDPDLSDGRILIWQDEEASENDDGVRAVASVYEVWCD